MHIKAYLVTDFFCLLSLPHFLLSLFFFLNITQNDHTDSSHSHTIKLSAAFLATAISSIN